MTEGFALHEVITNESGRPSITVCSTSTRLRAPDRMVKGDVIGRRVTEILPGIESFWIETYGRVG